MPERFNTAPQFVFTYAPVEDLKHIERAQPLYLEVTGLTADQLCTARHGLGHVPRGMKIVNVEADDAVSWYRLSTDPDWTGAELSFRPSADAARLLLEVI